MQEQKTCNRCGAPIEWRKSQNTGKWYPVNPNGTLHSEICGKPAPIEQQQQDSQVFKQSITIDDYMSSTMKTFGNSFKDAMEILEAQPDFNKELSSFERFDLALRAATTLFIQRCRHAQS